MAFIPQDLYLTSGTVGVINNWQSTVTKFDSSTFYNWEEDNMPVYDLEDRTDYLWERVGYPIRDGFSGIPGKMFVVSADYGFESGKDSSGIIFRNLSSVINVLPNPITYPIIIEVASFGNLGELNLNNIKIDDSCPGAGLEIVNRGFARSKFGLTSAPSAIYSVADNLVSSLMVKNMFHSASSLALSAAVLSATTDTRLNNNNRAWVVNYAYGNQSSPVTINSLLSQKPILSYKDSQFDQTLGTNLFALAEYGNTQDGTISTYDTTSLDSITSQSIARTLTTSSNVAMLAYGNYLTNAKISNCDGPIFIRGFCVDGALDTAGASLAHTVQTGFNIINSDITIENCMAMRCSDYGFKVINSNVDVRRGIVGTRIYSVSSTPTKRNTTTNGIGLYAENSLINFVPVSTAYAQYSGVDLISQFAFNDIGIQLNNSKIMGGNAITAAFTPGDGPTMIQAMYNTKMGIQLNNSIWDHKGGTEVYNNYKGLVANNSKLNIPLITAENNQLIGVEANTCQMLLNPDLVRPTAGTGYSNTAQIGEDYKQFNFFRNGQHMILTDSSMKYPSASSLPTKLGNILAASSFGVYSIGATTGRLPAFEVKENSTAEFVHASIKTYQEAATYPHALFGACMSVYDNSKVTFKGSIGNGTAFGPTMLIGPKVIANQGRTAAVYAGKNSEIEFNGNTLIAQAGVDVLAENNSVMRFNPHRTSDKVIDVSGWNLNDTGNHTRVELHSTRACLVADNNSVIEMEDIGDYTTHWAGNVLPGQDYNNTDTMGYGPYTSAGYIQFYPNPQDLNTLNDNPLLVTPKSIGSYSYTNTAPGYFLTSYYGGGTSVDDYSRGGLCVRAVNGSKTKVLNVNFAAGWYNTSGQFYDASSSTCEELRIWNIGEGSELHAAYCSVSSVYPNAAGYYGPSSVYTSAANAAASGAPSSTPDTSSLSVLDYYGASATRPAKNYGAFRLYFSPNSQAKMIGFASGTGATSGILYGAGYQMLAQGYNPSGNMVGSSAFDTVYSGISTPNFYYVSAMLDPSYRNRIRLDESAADTFANARHNAIGKSGRHPLVTIYRATATPGGQGYSADIQGYGKGFISSEIFDLRRTN